MHWTAPGRLRSPNSSFCTAGSREEERKGSSFLLLPSLLPCLLLSDDKQKLAFINAVYLKKETEKGGGAAAAGERRRQGSSSKGSSSRTPLSCLLPLPHLLQRPCQPLSLNKRLRYPRAASLPAGWCSKRIIKGTEFLPALEWSWAE